MKDNIILFSDSYKLTHDKQYPHGTTKIYSYFESRQGAKFPNTLFFGLQYILKRYMLGQVVTEVEIQEASDMSKGHFGDDSHFNIKGWKHILKNHGGQLPVRIMAVPEGSVIPQSNVLMTVENTDPKCFWLTSFLETLLVQSWYSSTVGTQSYYIKKILRDALKSTGCVNIEDTLMFMLHDFGCRGATTMEAAGIGGASHLVNFRGTDNLPALKLLKDYYGEQVAGYSVPASEHSTMTSWGEHGELEAFKNMLNVYPKGIVSIVSDSWDIKKAVSDFWCGELAEQVKARDGRVVIRPDSGHITEVNTFIVEALMNKFGYTKNPTGHKVLPPYIRIIQGDGMNFDSIREFIREMTLKGFAIENWSFGMGGGLLQKVDRDTQRFAFKASYTERDGKGFDVFKRPHSDQSKNSKKGRLELYKVQGKYQTGREGIPDMDAQLVTVYQNGRLLVDQSFEDIRKISAQ